MVACDLQRVGGFSGFLKLNLTKSMDIQVKLTFYWSTSFSGTNLYSRNFTQILNTFNNFQPIRAET